MLSSCSPLFPQERQRSAEAGRALRRDRASVELHDGLDNGEAEAGLGFGAGWGGCVPCPPGRSGRRYGNRFGGDPFSRVRDGELGHVAGTTGYIKSHFNATS
jgi:hypothetical protein